MSRRIDNKCQDLPSFKSLADAQAAAARKQTKHAAFGCDCGGYHIVKVGKTRRQQRRAEYDDYYGDLVGIVRQMIGLEMQRYKSQHRNKRRP